MFFRLSQPGVSKDGDPSISHNIKPRHQKKRRTLLGLERFRQLLRYIQMTGLLLAYADGSRTKSVQ